MLKKGIPRTIRNVALAKAIRPGMRITVRERRYQKPSERGARVRLGAALEELRRERVHPLAQEGEDGGEDRQGDERGGKRDERAADPHRIEEALGEDGQRRQGARDRDRRVGHGPACRRHRASQRLHAGAASSRSPRDSGRRRTGCSRSRGPRPRPVTRLSAKIEIEPSSLATVRSRNVETIARPPMRSGSAAATRLRKKRNERRKRIGKARSSAR